MNILYFHFAYSPHYFIQYCISDYISKEKWHQAKRHSGDTSKHFLQIICYDKTYVVAIKSTSIS